MNAEQVYNVNLSEDSKFLKKISSQVSNSADQKDIKNLRDLPESYNFLKNEDMIDELCEEKDNNKTENIYNEILTNYEEKNEHYDDEKCDFFSYDKSENSLNEKNEYCFLEKSDILSDGMHKKLSDSSYSIHEESLLKTYANLEENIYRDMVTNTYNECYLTDERINRTIPLHTKKTIHISEPKEELSDEKELKGEKVGTEENAVNAERELSERKIEDQEKVANSEKESKEQQIKYIYKPYTPTPIPETEETGLWFIDTINKLLDKVCDINKKDDYLYNLDIIQSYPNDDVLYTKLNESIKVKWSDYLKFSNLIYYNHILNIYETIYKKLIKDEQKIFTANKNSMKRVNSIPLPKFSHQDLKDRCASKFYEKLPELKTINEENGITASNNTEDNTSINVFFEQFVDKIKKRYNKFCDRIGEKLENLEKKNNFKEYCVEVSKILIKSILNTIHFSKIPVILNNMLESLYSCIKSQNKEMENTILVKSNNSNINNKMETLYSFPVGYSNTTFNSNTSTKLNNMQNKTIILSYNSFSPSNDENNNLLINALPQKCNTNDLGSLTKYTKTYANNISKLNSNFRSYDISKFKKIKNNSYINIDLPFNNKISYSSLKKKYSNRNLNGGTNINFDANESEKEDCNFLEKGSNLFTNVFNDPYKMTNTLNYYTVNSLPIDEPIRLETSYFNKKI